MCRERRKITKKKREYLNNGNVYQFSIPNGPHPSHLFAYPFYLSQRFVCEVKIQKKINIFTNK